MIRYAIMALLMIGSVACNGQPSQPLLTRDPQQWLITIDQLPTPDFTIQEVATVLPLDTYVNHDHPALLRLQKDGFMAAATVRYFRSVPTFAESNGPVDIIATAARFSNTDGASQALHDDVARRESKTGERAIAPGDLGDEAHADIELATAPDTLATTAVQITIEWRVRNVLNIITIRGRYGGARLDDGLLLAHRQTTNEISGPPPSMSFSPSSSSKARQSPTPEPLTASPRPSA